MKKQAKKYSAEEKAKVAVEAMKGEMTIAQIISKYGVHANQVYKWKKEAIEYMVSGFKSKSRQQEASQEELVKSLFAQIGQLIVERRSLQKNLRSLGLEVRKKMISKVPDLSIARQCELLLCMKKIRRHIFSGLSCHY